MVVSSNGIQGITLLYIEKTVFVLGDVMAVFETFGGG